MQGVEVAPDADLDHVAGLADGYSGDDLTNICRDAAMNGLRRKIEGKTPDEITNMDIDEMKEPIRMEDFIQAFEKIRPSVGQDDLKRHTEWRDEFGST